MWGWSQSGGRRVSFAQSRGGLGDDGKKKAVWTTRTSVAGAGTDVFFFFFLRLAGRRRRRPQRRGRPWTKEDMATVTDFVALSCATSGGSRSRTRTNVRIISGPTQNHHGERGASSTSDDVTWKMAGKNRRGDWIRTYTGSAASEAYLHRSVVLRSVQALQGRCRSHARFAC